MKIHYLSVLLTGETNIMIPPELLTRYSIHIEYAWHKNDTFSIGCRKELYDNNGTLLRHNLTFAENYSYRTQIINDYIHFLDELHDQVQMLEINIVVTWTVYIENSCQFKLLTSSELRQLLRVRDVTLRVDILPYDKLRFIELKKEFKQDREKYAYSRNSKKIIPQKATNLFYYVQSNRDVPYSIGWDADELCQFTYNKKDLVVRVHMKDSNNCD